MFRSSSWHIKERFQNHSRIRALEDAWRFWWIIGIFFIDKGYNSLQVLKKNLELSGFLLSNPHQTNLQEELHLQSSTFIVDLSWCCHVSWGRSHASDAHCSFQKEHLFPINKSKWIHTWVRNLFRSFKQLGSFDKKQLKWILHSFTTWDENILRVRYIHPIFLDIPGVRSPKNYGWLRR